MIPYSHRQTLTFGVVAICVVLILGGCGGGSSNQNSLNLPHYGMFLMEQGNLIEIVESKGGPPAGGIPSTSNAQPTIYAWVADLNLSLVVLASESGTGSAQYTTQPLAGNVLAIQPREALANGLYCFTEGSPSIPYSLLRNWCFNIGSNQVSAQQSNPELSTSQLGEAGVSLDQSGKPIIAFHSSRSGNDDIYLMNSDGTGVTQLTNDLGFDKVAVWSPDGKKIAFASSRPNGGSGWGIWVMNADGSDQQLLTSSTAEIYPESWSSDGRYISLGDYRSGNVDLYIMNSDGTDVKLLVQHPARDECSKFSPDGSKVLFMSDRSYSKEIYTVKPDGTNVQQITSGAQATWCPTWSPNGNRIVFPSTKGIFTMNADGTDLIQLTSGTSDFYPSYSPDAASIVFDRNIGGNNEIFLMRTDGSNQVRLTENSANDEDPVWRPTGNSQGVASSQLTPDFSQPPESESSAKLSNDITRTIANSLGTVLKNNQSTPKASAILLIQATSDLTSIASKGLDQLDIICSPITGLTYLQSVLGANFSQNPMYAAGDYMCTYGQGYIAALEALSASSVPFALVPILLQPEKYVDPWLDPINEAAWKFPITCTLFPDASICK